MPLDSRSVSAKIPEESLGTLEGCLVEGDPEQRNRERRSRRRSLIISILVQATVLASLILIPLFGKTERITFPIATPIPPYGHPPHASSTARSGQHRPQSSGSRYVFNTTNRPIPQTPVGEEPVGPPEISSGGGEQMGGPECTWCVNIGTQSSGPRPPQQQIVQAPARRRIVETRIDPAMLIRRVEPVYPPLAIQIHKEGRVELRAIIATDGTIQSLEVVSGDPLFYQSAKEAVSQWLYRPTVLNGQRVEVDTYITVIYTMPH